MNVVAKNDQLEVPLKPFKKELSAVAPLFKSFRRRVKHFKTKDMKIFNELSEKLPEENLLADHIRNLLFIVKLSRYVREEKNNGGTEIWIDNVVDLLDGFPKLYQDFITEARIKRKALPHRNNALVHKQSAHTRRSALTDG